MIRPVPALTGLLLIAASAGAMTDSRRESSLSDRAVAVKAARPPRVELFPTRATAASERELEVTGKTEVKLDGRPCRYEEVPDGVEAVFVEVADDGRTVLRIHFRRLRR